jgi:hypothetical protein
MRTLIGARRSQAFHYRVCDIDNGRELIVSAGDTDATDDDAEDDEQY